MTNDEFVEIWLNYGCATRGVLRAEGGWIFEWLAGHWMPLAGTNIFSGARFSLLIPHTKKVWLDKSYTILVSPPLRKAIQSHCVFRCGSNWASVTTPNAYNGQQWMRGYWGMTARLSPSSDTQLLVPSPCFASSTKYEGKKLGYQLPPLSKKWIKTGTMIPYDGPAKQHFTSPFTEWPFEVQALATEPKGEPATLPHIVYHFRMYEMASYLMDAKSECHAYYKKLKV